MPAKLCLNMIVKNESAAIERCLASVADYVSCYAITDTGSTDDTVEKIIDFFDKRGIPGEVHYVEFKNFGQARNEALAHARRESVHEFDYILLCDADMELVVTDKDFLSKLGAPSYTILQTNGAISYWNTRLLRRELIGQYVGVTHEYLDVPAFTQLHGVVYVDHGDGANREGKFTRDIDLLDADLRVTERSWFYMAQSLKDNGQIKEAAEAYRTRANMRGWDEEIWYARLMYSRMLRHLGDIDGFLREALVAYNQRPSRAEPLYDLANYYRCAGQNNLAVMFAETGMAIPRPNDLLFVEDFVYSTGLREEMSIAGFYDDTRRDRAFAICNHLALDIDTPAHSKDLARQNLYYYLQPLAHWMPSWKSQQIEFTPPDGYRAMNPSVTRVRNKLVTNVRCVNYNINEQGGYDIIGADGSVNDQNPIHTRNFLVQLSDALHTCGLSEICPPSDLPVPAYKLVIGFEDVRLFSRAGELWGSACVRELAADGLPEQVLFRIVDRSLYTIAEDWRVMRPEDRQCEKNWMPISASGQLSFMYRLGHIVSETGALVTKHSVPSDVGAISGGSQVIKFNAGWLAIVHEARYLPTGHRYYQHRFVWFDHTMQPRRLSLPFVFESRQIEFAAGLAHHPDGKRLVLSFGVRDKEAWLATVTSDDVVKFLWKEVS